MTSKLRPRAFLLAFLALLLTSVPARADVILSFSFAAVNLAENPQDFTFTFSLPFVDGPYDTLSSEFSTSVTDLDNSGAAAVNPFDASGFMLVPNIDGTAVLAAALGAGCAPIDAPGFTATCDPLSTASVGVVTLANGVLGATVSFILSGGDSIIGQGEVRLSGVVVPEPGSLLLLGLGAGAVAARRRRSREPLA
jgi:hypothetical protein